VYKPVQSISLLCLMECKQNLISVSLARCEFRHDFEQVYTYIYTSQGQTI